MTIKVCVCVFCLLAGVPVFLTRPKKAQLAEGSFIGVRRRTHLHNKTAEEVERIVQAGKVRDLK